MKKIAYAIVDKKGRIMSCFLDGVFYIYKTKKQALQDVNEDEKVIKVKIELYQK